MIDFSPPDEAPTFEQMIHTPLGPPKYDYDGSIHGCAVCGHRFRLMESRVAYIQAGKLLHRCTSHTEDDAKETT